MKTSRIPRSVTFALGASALLVAATPAQEPARVRVTGRMVLVEDGRPAAERGLDRTRAAVWFEPAHAGPPPAAVNAEMTTQRKQFAPQLLVVPVGSTVRFPNQDPILHNVFSVSGKNAFDLGLVGSGKGKSATFRQAGLVRVFCNVHHAMFSHVLVVSTPHYAQPDRSGAFSLAGLPPGPGTLYYWHERAEVASRRIVAPYPGELELELTLTQPRVPPHKNKFGKTYARGGYE